MTGFSTRAIHTHYPEGAVPSESIAMPIFQTASFEFAHADEMGAAIHRPEDSYTYSRLGNPTVARLEGAIAELEGGERGLAFASGMAAIYCALIHHLSAGDHVVAPSALYGGSFQILRKILPRFGIQTSFIDHLDPSAWRRA